MVLVPTYEVRFDAERHRWRVTGPCGERTFGTMQTAIQFAKLRAFGWYWGMPGDITLPKPVPGDVVWYDREGNEQGRVPARGGAHAD